MELASGFLLDTGVVLHATRENSPVSQALDQQFGLSTSRFRPAICEVSIGELLAFTLSGKWGERRNSSLPYAALSRQIGGLAAAVVEVAALK